MIIAAVDNSCMEFTSNFLLFRGMFSLRTYNPVVTETLPIPRLCLTGRAPPRSVYNFPFLVTLLYIHINELVKIAFVFSKYLV